MKFKPIETSSINEVLSSIADKDEREKNRQFIIASLQEIRQIQKNLTTTLDSQKSIYNNIVSELNRFEKATLPQCLNQLTQSINGRISESTDEACRKIDEHVNRSMEKLNENNFVIPGTYYYIMIVSLILSAVFVCLVCLYQARILIISSLAWITVPIISFWLILIILITYCSYKINH